MMVVVSLYTCCMHCMIIDSLVQPSFILQLMIICMNQEDLRLCSHCTSTELSNEVRVGPNCNNVRNSISSTTYSCILVYKNCEEGVLMLTATTDSIL